MEKRAAVVVGGPRRGPRGTLRSRMWSISAWGVGNAVGTTADCMYCATLSGNSTSNYADDCNYTVCPFPSRIVRGALGPGFMARGGRTQCGIFTPAGSCRLSRGRF